MINVALTGNPNTGKTTLFNTLTSSHEHTGNWHGVTVEEREKVYKFNGEDIKLVDLPGIYSLSPMSYEEEVSVNYLLSKKVDVVLNICDASNLKRNLYLTLSLLELGLPVILIVNQIDKRPICSVDYKKLQNMLNLPIIYISASNKDSIQKVNQEIISLIKKEHVAFNLPYLRSLNLSDCKKIVGQEKFKDFYAIKLFEDDEFAKRKFSLNKEFGGCEKMGKLRYEYIDDVLSKCCGENKRVYGSSKLDKIFLNKFLALPIFVCLLAVSFYFTFFTIGKWLSEGLSIILDKFLASPIENLLIKGFGQESWVLSLYQVAIVGGVGSIITFLPQVALLFFFLSLLEDSGYLSRVAFMFEDILGKVGLSGKSVYTLLMGFGCSTTAVLTARTMDDKNSKIKTSLLTPYMSCSAKFPIYSVIGGVFFGANNIFVIIGLYFLGVGIAILMSLIYEKTILKSKEQSFLLEFPPYRLMNIKKVFSILLQNVKDFIIRVGSLILAMNVIVWFLSNFTITLHFVGADGVSMLETFGKILLPIFKPIGIESWGLVSALFAGLVAKEVIVSSIALFSGAKDDLLLTGQALKDPSSAVFFASKSAVFSYLVFCLLYFPCLATASVLGKEIGKKWFVIGSIIEFAIAYLIAFVSFRMGLVVEACGILPLLAGLGLMLLIFASIIILLHFIRKKGCGRCKKSCQKRNTF